jgi:tRNA-Thr(GGU) m(6)t(6)A37 methyltransferase TsaA
MIHSPFQKTEHMPIQPVSESSAAGTVVLFPQYQAGLQDLDGFSHIFLLYHLHRSSGFQLSVVPFLDDEPHGLFATRAPRRPNPIGLSIVRLVEIRENVLHVQNLDVLDGTPLLDIKPYAPGFDAHPGASSGWLSQADTRLGKVRSDRRFNEG